MSMYDTLLAEDADRGQPQHFRAYAAHALTARGLTFNTACAAAKEILGNMEPWWRTQPCERIVQELQNNATLFTCPHEVRCGLIPVGQAGSCTAAQCGATLPCGGQTPCSDGTCPPCTPVQCGGQQPCANGTCPPCGGGGGAAADNTLLYVGLGIAAIAAVMLLAKPTQGNKVLYAKPA